MRIRCVYCLAAVALFVALLLHAPIAAASTPQHVSDILLLSSYHAGDSWTDELVAGVRSVLQTDGVHDIHVEHLDARRHGKETYDAYFRDYLRRKYADIPLALAIVADDAAFEFFLNFRREFFPDLPMVFCGVNNFDPARIQGERLVTGVNETLDIVGTVNIALDLVPRATRMAVVGGDSGIAKKNLELFHAAAPQFERALEIIELLDVRRGEAPNVFGRLPERTLLFRMANLREDGGGDVSLQESARLISRHANAPMFTFWEFDIGHGAVGGIVASGFHQGRTAAELALRILEGESADAIPVVMRSPNVAMFDFAQMRRFGFKEAKLPESAQFVNKPFSLYERLRKVVWIVLALMTFMAVSIVALLAALHVRRKSERASRANERFLRSLLETIPNPIYYKGAQGRYQGCNNAFAEMLGLTREQVIGRTVHEVNQDEFADVFADKDAELLRNPGVQVYEAQLRNGRGQIRDVLLSKATFAGECEEVAGIVGVVLDITERNQFQEMLQRAKEAAEYANRSKSEFLANMSHEIRTPLNGVMGMLRLVQAAPLNDELREYVEAAALSCKRLTALLSDILDLSRIEAGKMEIVNEVFDPRKTMQEVEGVFGLTAAQKGVILECSVDQGVPRLLFGDVMRLRQVLLNLVGNAVKFTSHGAVSVKAWALPGVHSDGVRLYMAVSDTGPGMTPELMETIFEPFAQGEASYTRRHQGAGLGLPIVKRLVRLMGGSLALESTPDEGSVFHLCIPFALAAEGEQAASDGEPVEAAGPRVRYRILLVEDEVVNQLATKRLLQMQGHDVHTAENGLQALQALRENLFDLVFMDVQMPEMDGMEATRMIREAPEFAAIAAIPIVALTAYAMDGDRESFLAAGMNDYLAKPVDEAMLAEVIRRVMSGKG